MKKMTIASVGIGLLVAGGAIAPAFAHATELPTPPPYEDIRPFEFSFPIATFDAIDTEVIGEPEFPTYQEDDPEWDCRVMGDLGCGVELITNNGEHIWYVIQFENGQPVSVRER